MYYVYILKSLTDKRFYAGYTADLRKRLNLHNGGKVVATRNRRPFKIIYYEAYLNQQDATSREKFFKTQWGRNYLKRVLKYFLSKDA
jgi:putative endonuclease